MFRAAVCHVGPRSVVIDYQPLDHTPKTDAPRQVEKHHSIACLESPRERTGIVTVNDPRVALEHAVDRCSPLIFGRLDPARSPVERIEMNDFYTENLSQLPREGRLTKDRLADSPRPTDVNWNQITAWSCEIDFTRQEQLLSSQLFSR